MTSTKSQKTSGSKKKSKPELTDEEKQGLSESANQIREQHADINFGLPKNHGNFLLTDPELAIKIVGEVVFPLTNFP